jgi:hypothetical protein
VQQKRPRGPQTLLSSGNRKIFLRIKCYRFVNIFINTHLLFQIKTRANIILTTRKFSLHIAELNTRTTESSHSPLLAEFGSICHGSFDVRFHKMTNLFWSVITYRLVCLVVIVIEGKLKKRSSAHGVSNKVNTVFSGKIASFLPFQIPLAYTAVYNYYFHTPTFIWQTPSLQFRACSCISVLEAHTDLHPEATVLIMTRL